MKRIWFPLLLIFFLAASFCILDERVAKAAKTAAARVSCADCHTDMSAVLPKGHPPVKGNNLEACTPCHQPDMEGKPQKNAYSARMHRAHVPPNGKLECTACHDWTPGKKFGLKGSPGSWGAPSKEDMKLMKEIFASWASSKNADNRHAKGGVVCASCHGKQLPKADSTVENPRCLECHGPMEKLAKRSEPKDFPDRNPHKSHLGDINCTVCHHEHAPSKVYCLDCHRNFKMKIPGGE